MIDYNDIKVAARKCSKTKGCDKKEALLIEEGFKEGVNWVIKESFNDLWHDANKRPKENSDIFYLGEYSGLLDIDNYNSNEFKDSFGKGWGAACRILDIHIWAYKEEVKKFQKTFKTFSIAKWL